MLNSVKLMGRLVADPELRQTQSGIPVCSIRIAVDRDFLSGGTRVNRLENKKAAHSPVIGRLWVAFSSF